ncbi:MAG: hypothetical protein ABSE69_06895 [Roseiarcus sp.]|jgi:hypothetical protein
MDQADGAFLTAVELNSSAAVENLNAADQIQSASRDRFDDRPPVALSGAALELIAHEIRVRAARLEAEQRRRRDEADIEASHLIGGKRSLSSLRHNEIRR